MTDIAIWAPHGDDEIIGCYAVLTLPLRDARITVWFGTQENTLPSLRKFGCSTTLMPSSDLSLLSWDIVYAPDPSIDNHPLHQRFGYEAQKLFRSGHIRRLIHYTTTMRASYIFELPAMQAAAKLRALNECYPHKSSLWEWDHRYWLFEGYVEWLRPPQVG